MRLRIAGGRVLDPGTGVDGVMDVLIDDGHIAAVGPGAGAGADAEIPAHGCWVLPGVIDLRARLREPGDEQKETIATGTRAAAAGGVSALVALPDTRPPADEAAVVAAVQARAREQAAIRVWPTGCLTRGGRGEALAELGDLARAGAVAFTDADQSVKDTALLRNALLYAGEAGRPVILHALDPYLAQGGVMREGPVSVRLGLTGIPAEAEAVVLARDLALAAATGARVHVAHVSTARAVELLREAKSRGVAVSADVTPHHLFLTDAAMEQFNPSAKVLPPLGSDEDRRALRHALAEGIVDAVASDHAPHAPEEKAVEIDQAPFGAVELETLVSLVLGELVQEGVLSPMQAVATLTLHPARALGLAGGRLQAGEVADVTIFDPRARWEVDPGRFVSRGRNSPFAGWRLTGRAVATIVGGRPVMRDGELLV